MPEGTAATPSLSPDGDTYSEPILVSLASTTEDATIRYTLDGTAPSATSAIYRFPFVVAATTTVKAQAFRASFTPSGVSTETYVLDDSGAAGTPVISPAGGQFVTQQAVTVTGPVGATLRYTTDGTDPTDTDPTVSSPITIDRSLVLKVRAWDTGVEPSAVRRADFVVTGAVAAGLGHTLALKSNRTLWAWGLNSSGQIGDGSGVSRLSPVQVLTNVVAVAAGARHTLAIRDDGTVWAWGLNGDGQLGDGTTTNRLSPQEVPDLDDVVAVAAGLDHSLALDANGAVWAWGANDDGQVGDGTTTERLSPVAVVGLGGVTAIAVGQAFSVAVTGDDSAAGAVWAWGRNDHRQLGDDTTLSRSIPIRVNGLEGVCAIVAGRDAAMAHTVAGAVAAWGGGGAGQLGSGALLDRALPAVVVPLSGVQGLGSGPYAYHALAFDDAARTWGWGEQVNGQLGRPENVYGSAFVPQLVPLPVPPVALSAGAEFSVVAAADGSVVTFGDNGSGQLGDGTTTNSNDPVVVPSFSLATNTWLVTDADDDGLTTWREVLLGTDPLDPDTNGNGIVDGLEELGDVSSADPDADQDGVPSWIEEVWGTDPFQADSDGDSVDDGSDAFPLDPTRSDPLTPTQGDTTPPVITLIEPTSAEPVP